MESQVSDLYDPARRAGRNRAAGATNQYRAGHPADGRRALPLAFVPGMPAVELPPGLVLLMVLPPLIYSASVAMSWREFKSNLRPVILLAVGCVIFTAFMVAAATHYLIELPWSVGFLLGAIVAPPDVVAPLAIARKLGLPRRILVVLEGEGLANDATALILYRFAVAAISDGAVLAAEGHRHLRGHRRLRDPVQPGDRLALPARTASHPGSADRDHAVADHPLPRFLDPRAFRRVRRDRNRRLRALHELERTAADFRGDPPAGHLLLGPRDLSDRGHAVPAYGIPNALLYEKSKAFPLQGDRVHDGARCRHRHHRPLCLGLSRNLPAAPHQRANCANAIRPHPGAPRSCWPSPACVARCRSPPHWRCRSRCRAAKAFPIAT